MVIDSGKKFVRKSVSNIVHLKLSFVSLQINCDLSHIN
jgi:hypothetical protein